MQVLLVDHDPERVRHTCHVLETDRCRVSTAASAEIALQTLAAMRFDCLLLELCLPDEDARQLCRSLRAAGSESPVLLLTSVDDADVRVSGLRAGADDCLSRPYIDDELLARVHAITRRSFPGTRQGPAIQFADLRLEPALQDAFVAGRMLELTPLEFTLLRALVARSQSIAPAAALQAEMWGGRCAPNRNLLAVHVRNLRAKLERAGSVVSVRTLRRRGYRVTA
jgi:DNA-binding response OmpR family regulator